MWYLGVLRIFCFTQPAGKAHPLRVIEKNG